VTGTTDEREHLSLSAIRYPSAMAEPTPPPRTLELQGCSTGIGTATATLTMRWRLRWPDGRGGWAYEKVEGPNFYRESGEMRSLLRIIDHAGDRYRELIVGPDGTVHRDVDEPLSQHTDRGSARPKR